jgi:hypothetical protein
MESVSDETVNEPNIRVKELKDILNEAMKELKEKPVDEVMKETPSLEAGPRKRRALILLCDGRYLYSEVGEPTNLN